MIIFHFLTFMVKSYYIYRDSDYYIYGSNIITFIVSTLLHLWLVRITFMVGITYFMVSVTFMIDYYISGWKDSPPFPLQTYVLESVSNDECSFSAAFSSNIWKVFMEESGFWYSFIAALILESLYSCSTDRKPRCPLSRDRYIAVELSGCLPPLSRMIFLTSLSI